MCLTCPANEIPIFDFSCIKNALLHIRIVKLQN